MESKFYGYNKKQWKIFPVLAAANLMVGIVNSLTGPLYPAEAESKGASSSAYGFVIGIYDLVNCIGCVLLGAYMDKLGPSLVFKAGVLTTGIATTIFGLLHFLNGAVWFIVTSYLIRIAQATGMAAAVTASSAIISGEFSNAIAKTFAIGETFVSIGYCIGPPIGGVLYEAGGKNGFVVPFATIGSFLILMFPIVCISFWKLEPSNTRNSEQNASDFNTKIRLALSLLKIPSISLYIFALFIGSLSLDFITTLLGPQLRQQFNLTPVIIGLVFTSYAIAIAIAGPVMGILSTKISQATYITLAGSIFFSISSLFIGPAPFLSFNSILWLTILGLIVLGLGVACINISSFLLILKAAKENNFPDNVSTRGMISGIYRGTMSLGGFTGPSIAGVLNTLVGFRYATLFLLVLQFILIIAVVAFLIREIVAPKEVRKNSTPPLPDGSNDDIMHILIKNQINYSTLK